MTVNYFINYQVTEVVEKLTLTKLRSEMLARWGEGGRRKLIGHKSVNINTRCLGAKTKIIFNEGCEVRSDLTQSFGRKQ